MFPFSTIKLDKIYKNQGYLKSEASKKDGEEITKSEKVVKEEAPKKEVKEKKVAKEEVPFDVDDDDSDDELDALLDDL